MKRRTDPECTAPLKKQKRIGELARHLSSTSDDEPLSSVSHAAKASTTSLSGSDSETEGKQPCSDGFKDAFKADSLVEGTSSRYSMYNSVSQKLMAKMGFREGEGLGKYSQGRKDIVETSNQKGRRGLGLTLQGFDQELNVDWRDEPEPNACEQVSWFPECTTEIPDSREMSDWMVVGKRKMVIEDETEFCGEELLHSMLKCKSVFDILDGEEMRRARTRANPYEMIRGVFFLNRAAMKMANMDFVFDRMFTNPLDSSGKPLLKESDIDLLYFADVCAGPGGFSEYVLWRRKWHAKGFGMTLKGPNDFKLEDFYSASSELFEPYYGEGGVDGDGDITRPENINAFRNFVLDNTDRKGVHFVMADGGFSVEGQENLQEILSKQLLLCQFLMALSVVRTGGHFVCKTFDLFTPFSVGLIYLLYCCFERVCLFKPVTSRPANSERYVVCKGLKVGIDDVREYLFSVNIQLNQLRNTDSDVNLVVPLSVIKGDHEFNDYMIRSNESYCSLQIKALAKIHAFVQDTTLSEPRQAEIRKECLQLWEIPDRARVAPSPSDPKFKFFELIKDTDINIFSYKPTLLTAKTLEKIRPVLEYRCMVSGSEQKFLLGLGKSQIYTWDGRQSDRWVKLDLKTELPRDTLLCVEIVHELKGEGKAQRKISAIHILDVLVLNGSDVREQHFNQRIQLAEKFVKAVSKPSRPDMNPIRVKEVYRLEEMEKIFVRLEMKLIKGSGGTPKLSYTGRDDRHFVPTGVYIVRTVTEPWTMAFSKGWKKKFFYNKKTGESFFTLPPESIAPFQSQEQRVGGHGLNICFQTTPIKKFHSNTPPLTSSILPNDPPWWGREEETCRGSLKEAGKEHEMSLFPSAGGEGASHPGPSPYRDHLNSNENIIKWPGTWVTWYGASQTPGRRLGASLSLPAPEHPSCPGLDGWDNLSTHTPFAGRQPGLLNFLWPHLAWRKSRGQSRCRRSSHLGPPGCAAFPKRPHPRGPKLWPLHRNPSRGITLIRYLRQPGLGGVHYLPAMLCGVPHVPAAPPLLALRGLQERGSGSSSSLRVTLS